MHNKTILQLRQEGYAVAVFTPEELGTAKPFHVENDMVSYGWQAIAISGARNELQPRHSGTGPTDPDHLQNQ